MTLTCAHALSGDGRCRGSPDAVEHDDVFCARWGGVRALARGVCARCSKRLIAGQRSGWEDRLETQDGP